MEGIRSVLGWIPPVTLPWSANILAFAGWISYLFRRYVAAFRLASAAFLAALTTFPMVGFAGLMVGYYLWQTSFFVFMACAFVASEGERVDEERDGRPDVGAPR